MDATSARAAAPDGRRLRRTVGAAPAGHVAAGVAVLASVWSARRVDAVGVFVVVGAGQSAGADSEAAALLACP